MSAPSTIGWVAESGTAVQALPFVDAEASSGSLWPEIAVEEVFPSGQPHVPTELPPGHLVRHIVAVSMEAHPLEIRWLGGPSFSGMNDVGSITIFPARQSYVAQWGRTGRSLMLQISTPFAAATLSEELDPAVNLEPVFAKKDSFVGHAIHALHHLARDPGHNSRICGETLAISVVAHVVRRYGADSQRRRVERLPVPLDGSALKRIDQLIDERIGTTISVGDLAAVAGMSPFRFSRLFKLATGTPPHQYVLHRRIERAKSMLAGRRLRMADVALSCGFASQSHFSDTFRRVTGTTPRRFGRWVR